MSRPFRFVEFIRASDGRRLPNPLGILMLTLGCSPNTELPEPGE